MAYAALGRTLADLKHSITPAQQQAGARRGKPPPEQRDSRERMSIVIVDGRGKRTRLAVPVGSMGRLQDFLEDRMKILKSLQHVYFKDAELQPGDSKPFLTHAISDGDELHVVEESVVLVFRMPQGRTAQFRGIHLTDTISALKCRIEEQAGIPVGQQRIRYLEDSDLRDDMCLYDAGVVPGAALEVHLWPDWAGVLEAVRKSDTARLAKLLPNPADQGALDALFVAAFDGLAPLCRFLVAMGVNPARRSPRGTGRTPIHAAAGQGHIRCLQEMVSPRVAFYAPDARGVTAEMWAKQNGHGACADLLAMARWDLRTARQAAERTASETKLAVATRALERGLPPLRKT
eukprot:m.25880 g.25880  ORF g.25880 m.25880 type:complete len:347 (-) comp4218_c0_seq1:136-1176(-)